MFRLVSLGILSALFFSSTFVLNRAMSLEGGHWVWSACLRYAYMLLFLVAWQLLAGRRQRLVETLHAFRQNWFFWMSAGSIGFGSFYALICFSASFAPGWVVATTWQTTILASPLVLLLFGRKIPLKAVIFIGLIFLGILLVNLEQVQLSGFKDLLLGGVPVLFAAFAYPFGNQMVWEAQRGGTRRIPAITLPVVKDPFTRILLLSLGTVPFWLLLLVLTMPPPPTSGQFVNTALVALFSGLIATGLFLQARQHARNSYEISAIDSTQSSEVLFSLLGELVFLQGVFPGMLGSAGILLTLVGLTLYVRAQSAPG